jgi:chromate transport protein ChrA
MLCELRKRKTYWGVDLVLMSLQGLPGLLLLFMALFSQHPAVDCNWLVLLLNPLALVLMPMMVSRIRKHKSMKIAWVQVAFVALFLLTAMFGFQVYPTPIYFCAMALLARALFHLYKDKICELNIV